MRAVAAARRAARQAAQRRRWDRRRRERRHDRARRDPWSRRRRRRREQDPPLRLRVLDIHGAPIGHRADRPPRINPQRVREHANLTPGPAARLHPCSRRDSGKPSHQARVPRVQVLQGDPLVRTDRVELLVRRCHQEIARVEPLSERRMGPVVARGGGRRLVPPRRPARRDGAESDRRRERPADREPRRLKVRPPRLPLRVPRASRPDPRGVVRPRPAGRALVDQRHLRPALPRSHQTVARHRAGRQHLDGLVHLAHPEPRHERAHRLPLARIRIPDEHHLRLRLEGREVARRDQAPGRIVFPVALAAVDLLLLARERRDARLQPKGRLAHERQRPPRRSAPPDQLGRRERTVRFEVHRAREEERECRLPPSLRQAPAPEHRVLTCAPVSPILRPAWQRAARLHRWSVPITASPSRTAGSSNTVT